MSVLAGSAVNSRRHTLPLPLIRWRTVYGRDSPKASTTPSSSIRCSLALAIFATNDGTTADMAASSQPNPVERRHELREDRQVGVQPHPLDAAHAQGQQQPFCLSRPNSRSTAPRLAYSALDRAVWR